MLQLTVHCFAVQTDTPFAAAGHAPPHLPQLAGSESRFWQAAPHRLNFGSQLRLHLELAQAAEPCVPALHIAVQAPQLLGSLARLTQAPAQF